MPRHVTHLNHKPPPQLDLKDMPEAFTWCNYTGENHCTPSWNQHIPKYCGSCFLHATLSMLNDRLKIHKRGGMDVMLSRQTFLNCATPRNISGGCDGGDPIDVFRYMADVGLPDESCMIYDATDGLHYGDAGCPADAFCRNCLPINTPAPGVSQEVCWPVTDPLTYKLSSYGRIEGCGEAAMMSEIYQRGPIVCAAACDSDFMYAYRGGVYEGKNETEVDHNMEVVGWGVEDGVKYWHVRNSWGTYWGELGFVKIRRGRNDLMLESCNCWYGDPTWGMERAVENGTRGGTVHGTVPLRGRGPVRRGGAERAQALLRELDT